MKRYWQIIRKMLTVSTVTGGKLILYCTGTAFLVGKDGLKSAAVVFAAFMILTFGAALIVIVQDRS